MGMNKNTTNKRLKSVTMCLNPEEYQELVNKAEQVGMKPSVIARRLLLEHIRFYAQ